MPSNVELFKQICGLVFGQLYNSFPVRVNIDVSAVASALNVENVLYQDGKSSYGYLENGDFFLTFLDSVLVWLKDEGFIQTDSSRLTNYVIFTAKGFAGAASIARDSVPLEAESVGSKMAKYSEEIKSKDGTQKKQAAGLLGEFAGSLIGGVTKSLGGS